MRSLQGCPVVDKAVMVSKIIVADYIPSVVYNLEKQVYLPLATGWV